MAFRVNHSWTLFGLMSAFLDLALAHFLLCGSVLMFFTSKFLHVFGLYLPCPCTGFLGYQNSNLCLHRLLIDWPIRKIYSVQRLAKSRFPFDLVWLKDEEHNSNLKLPTDRKCGNEVLGLDNETSSSSFSGYLVDKGSGYDVKGKKIMNQKQRIGVRRRRRAAFGYGKPASVSLSDNMQSIVPCVFSSPNNGCEMRSEISESLGLASEIDDGLQDDRNAATGTDLGERTWNRFEVNGSHGETNGMDKDSSLLRELMSNAKDKLGTIGNETNVVRMLEQVLQEEKAARAALYLELEKERAAAASAADEAMAMILRLQENKASLEMEARQYERMIEEKFAYDEEEMIIMKEMLVKMERENHFLEKELEVYRQMNVLGNESLDGDLSYMINKGRQRPSVLLGLNEDLPLVPQLIGNSREVGSQSSNYEASVSYQLSPHSDGLLEKPTTLDGKGTVQGVDKKACQELTIKAVQSSGAIEKNLSCDEDEVEIDGEHGVRVGYDEKSSSFDKEPIVYDVHVIDDKTELWKEKNGRESWQLNCAASGSGVWTDKSLSDCPTTNMAESEPGIHGSSLDMVDRLGVLGNLQNKTSLFDSGRTSSSVSSERLKIDNEVEWLRERLRIVQEDKEKLTFSAEHRERVNAQLKLMEEIVNQLRDIQQMREPVQQASFPSY